MAIISQIRCYIDLTPCIWTVMHRDKRTSGGAVIQRSSDEMIEQNASRARSTWNSLARFEAFLVMRCLRDALLAIAIKAFANRSGSEVSTITPASALRKSSVTKEPD